MLLGYHKNQLPQNKPCCQQFGCTLVEMAASIEVKRCAQLSVIAMVLGYIVCKGSRLGELSVHQEGLKSRISAEV
jgi:hypothetical protein